MKCSFLIRCWTGVICFFIFKNLYKNGPICSFPPNLATLDDPGFVLSPSQGKPSSQPSSLAREEGRTIDLVGIWKSPVWVLNLFPGFSGEIRTQQGHKVTSGVCLENEQSPTKLLKYLAGGQVRFNLPRLPKVVIGFGTLAGCVSDRPDEFRPRRTQTQALGNLGKTDCACSSCCEERCAKRWDFASAIQIAFVQQKSAL